LALTIENISSIVLIKNKRENLAFLRRAEREKCPNLSLHPKQIYLICQYKINTLAVCLHRTLAVISLI